MNKQKPKIEEFIKQLNGSRHNLPNRYLLSKLMNIIEKVNKSREIKKTTRIIEMYTILESLTEPYDIQTAELRNESDLNMILDLYDEFIEFLNNSMHS